jgi:hypothetical protein
MESRIRPARKTRVKYRIERGRSCFNIAVVDIWELELVELVRVLIVVVVMVGLFVFGSGKVFV